jgi:nitrate reductase assembly molybdenum cofactor insertion protein NarJ
MKLEDALLAVLMYWPDQLARRMAQDQMDLVRNHQQPDKKMLGRIARLLMVRPDRAQHTDVWRAKPVIEEAARR